MSEFHFIRPLMLFGLLLLVVMFFLTRVNQQHRGAWTRVIDQSLQPYVLSGKDDLSDSRLNSLWFCLAAVLIVALAGPTWEKLPQPVYTQQRPLVIALDLSQSMNAKDLLPSRLELAKIKLQDILATRADGQCALVVFAGDAFGVVPLTDDHRTIVSLLPSLETTMMPVQGSRIAPAIAMAETLFRQADSQNGEVIVLTDGLVDVDAAQTAAETLSSRGHRVSVIGLGTTQGDLIKDRYGEFVRDRRGNLVTAKLPVKELRDLANAGQGYYLDATASSAAFEQLSDNARSAFNEATTGQNLSTDLWREQGPWLLVLCLPFIAMAFRKGLILVVLLMICFPSQITYASVWDDLWNSPDQQAQKQFDQENYQQAAELYEDPEHLAAALFRAKEYEQSAAVLNGIDHAEAHYNRGTALAHAGSIDGAIGALQSALNLQPDHEDAKHNLELLVQQQQEQQQQQQDQPQEGDEQQEQEGEDQQSGEDSDEGDEQEPQSSEEGEEEDSGETGEEQESQDQQEESDEQQETQEQQAQLSEQMTEDEQEQAVEQWLRRIPDDPGGLLRRKFKRQYRERDNKSKEASEQW